MIRYGTATVVYNASTQQFTSSDLPKELDNGTWSTTELASAVGTPATAAQAVIDFTAWLAAVDLANDSFINYDLAGNAGDPIVTFTVSYRVGQHWLSCDMPTCYGGLKATYEMEQDNPYTDLATMMSNNASPVETADGTKVQSQEANDNHSGTGTCNTCNNPNDQCNVDSAGWTVVGNGPNSCG